MRKIVSAGTLVVFLAFLVMPSIGFAQKDGPRISIEEMRHDFGEIFEAKTYKHTFTIKNIGNALLRIDKVQPG